MHLLVLCFVIAASVAVLGAADAVFCFTLLPLVFKLLPIFP